MIRRTIHQFKQADYSRLVDLMNASTRRSLSQYTRDEAARVLWHITLSQPRLLLLGLRGLLSGGSILPRTVQDRTGRADRPASSEYRTRRQARLQ